jgi:archaellin
VDATTGTWNGSGGGDYQSYYAWGNDTQDQNELNTTKLTVMEFQVELAAGQNPIDMDKMVISYSDADTYVAQVDAVTTNASTNASSGNLTVTATSGQWTYTLLSDEEMGGSNMLDPTEKMLILVALPDWGAVAYEEFMIDIKPAQGATLTLTKTAPGAIQKTMVLN